MGRSGRSIRSHQSCGGISAKRVKGPIRFLLQIRKKAFQFQKILSCLKLLEMQIYCFPMESASFGQQEYYMELDWNESLVLNLSSIFVNLLRKKAVGIFVYGAKENTNRAAVEILKKQISYIKNCREMQWLYKESEMPALIDHINNSHAEILFLALGSPKQENWFAKYHREAEIRKSLSVHRRNSGHYCRKC